MRLRDFVEYLVSADLPEPPTAELAAADAGRLADRWVPGPDVGFSASYLRRRSRAARAARNR